MPAIIEGCLTGVLLDYTNAWVTECPLDAFTILCGPAPESHHEWALVRGPRNFPDMRSRYRKTQERLHSLRQNNKEDRMASDAERLVSSLTSSFERLVQSLDAADRRTG